MQADDRVGLFARGKERIPQTGVQARQPALGWQLGEAVTQGLIAFQNSVVWGAHVQSLEYLRVPLITFAAESGRQLRLRSYATFAVMQTGGLIANTTTVFVLSYFMPVLVAKLFAVAASFLVNFSLSHFVVFRRRHKTTQL